MGPVDVSIVRGDFLWSALYEHLEHADDEWYLSERSIELHPDLSIFRWLRFPLVQYSKEDMLEEAKRRGFEPLLEMTWSCWYPKKDGEPCLKCAMCRHRILKPSK